MPGELAKCSDFLISRCADVRKPDAVWRGSARPNTRQSLGPIAGLMFVALIGIAPRLFDPPPGELVLAVDAFGVHLEQHGDAVPGRLGDPAGGTPPLSPVDTPACRRSYRRRASGEEYSAEVSAARRARSHTRR